jgi:hypothetical protein
MSVQCSPAGWTPCKSKKELKEKLAEGVRKVEFIANTGGAVFADESPDGVLVVVGPSANDRRWYATVTVKNGQAKVT